MRVLKDGVDWGAIKRVAWEKVLSLLGVLGALGLLQWVQGVWPESRLLVSGGTALLVYCWVAWNVAELFCWTAGLGKIPAVDCERQQPCGGLLGRKTTKSCFQSMGCRLSAFCTTVAKHLGSAQKAAVLEEVGKGEMSKKRLKWGLGLIGVGSWGLLCAGVLMLGGAASALLGVVGCWVIAEVICWAWDRAAEKDGAHPINVGGRVGTRVLPKVIDVLPAIEGLPARFQARTKVLVERAEKLEEVARSGGQELAEQREQLGRIFGELLPSVMVGFAKLNADRAGGDEFRGEAEFVEVLDAVEERLAAFERHLDDRNQRLFFDSKETLGAYLKVTAPAEVERLGIV